MEYYDRIRKKIRLVIFWNLSKSMDTISFKELQKFTELL